MVNKGIPVTRLSAPGRSGCGAGSLLHLLMLAANGDSVDVHGDGHNDLGLVALVALTTGSAPEPRPRVHQPGLDPLPLGPPVLKPYFDLHLGESECTRNVRALGEGQVLLAVELLLQLQQLLAGERRATSP